ncbi:MAG: LLM class flavin-dependent oxidoreductase [Deltaproteobacteria bacterium]|nr:LLM class flavin-dependent oxidoreductase [Deltaproteobacteria bacterium]
MRAWHFSENAYHLLPDPKEYDSIRVTLPNRYYDPRIGADLYHRYIDEWMIADELGLEVMVNEHHQTATNLNPAGPIIMGILARETRRARLLILGNPIANRREPVRVAEEMAMVDVYSRGRLEVGFVRGVPYEISAGNHRPTRMMERFWEAHDLILKAWTSHDGPFNWEGKYFHHRQVNIWPRPYQQPHPPVWITALSPASAREVGGKGYVVACFLTGFEGTKTVFQAYRARRAELGLPASGLDRFAYAALVYTGETDEEGYAGARKLMWYVESNKVPLQFTNPPGYQPIAATVNAMKGSAGIFKLFQNPTLEGFMENGLVFAGNPDSVYRQIMKMYNYVGGFGHLLSMVQAGFLDHDETVKGMKLFSREVYPRLKELDSGGVP